MNRGKGDCKIELGNEIKRERERKERERKKRDIEREMIVVSVLQNEFEIMCVGTKIIVFLSHYTIHSHTHALHKHSHTHIRNTHIHTHTSTHIDKQLHITTIIHKLSHTLSIIN